MSYAPPPQQQYEQYEPEPAPPAVDPIQQLAELGELKEKGLLTDEEFAAQKANLLA
jgi:Short C-terminal domain